MKVLSSCNAPKSLNAKEMETLNAHSSEEDLKKRHFFMTCDNEDEPCQLIDRHRKRKNVISFPFMFRRFTHESGSQGHLESVLKPPLFDLPLSLVYGAEDTLPKSIQDILTILYQKGPFTEGIFRIGANEKARKELREELNARDNIALEKKSVYLLAVAFKVKTLVEFLINNCSDIFGEEIYSLFSRNTDNSLDMTDTSSPDQHRDSAYDSTDLEGECSLSDLQSRGLSHISRPSSTELYPKHPRTQIPSAFSLTHFKTTMKKLERRSSEPDLQSSKNCRKSCVKLPKLSKSEENFIRQKELGLKNRELRMGMQTVEESHPSGRYRNKKPSDLRIKANFPTELSSDSLLSTSSSSSLDSASSISDSSVFTSSPLPSPAIFKNNILTRPQSFSAKLSNGSDRAVSELKKHAMSFSVPPCKMLLAKTESQGRGCFQKGSFKKGSRKERALSCQFAQATHETVPSPEPSGCPLRSRFMSAVEVFRLVDQNKPRRPPSYEEATKHFSSVRFPSRNSLRAHPLRPPKVPQDPASGCLGLKKEITNKANENLFNDRSSLINDSQDKKPVVDFVIGIHSRANLPLTPQVYRLRTMSGSYQKNKQEYMTLQNNQITFEHLQCAKESYV